MEAERRGVQQTPTFVIGGKMVPGAIPYDAFKKLVDEELAKAPAAADTTAKGVAAPAAPATDSGASPKTGAR
jgi:predicted DsbA family dithiol-disulfide isomerase